MSATSVQWSHSTCIKKNKINGHVWFDSPKIEGVWYQKKTFVNCIFHRAVENLHWSWSWSGFILPSATSTLWGVWKPFFYFSQMILILLHFTGRTIESVGFIGNLLYFSQSSGDDLDLVTFCHQQLLLPSVWCQLTLETWSFWNFSAKLLGKLVERKLCVYNRHLYKMVKKRKIYKYASENWSGACTQLQQRTGAGDRPTQYW